MMVKEENMVAGYKTLDKQAQKNPQWFSIKKQIQ